MTKDLLGWYYAQSADGVVQIVQYLDGKCYYWGFDDIIAEPICRVPTYDEYKAMQEELAEFKRSITSYIGKPIDYDIACETVNKLLDDKEQLKKELKSARWYQTIMNEDIAELRALLKDIKLFFEECNPHDFTVVADNMDVYLTHINAALGESEG